MKMNFKLTDGRPWYKQVITGIFKGIALLVLGIPILFLALILTSLFVLVAWADE